ncbi:MAG: LCP family protein [Patescibacteria group bacterium]
MGRPKKTKNLKSTTKAEKIPEQKLQSIIESPETKTIKVEKSKKFAFNKKKAIILMAIFVVVLGVGFAYRIYSSTVDKIVEKDDQAGLITQVKNIAQKDDKFLQGEEEDRINVLLWGIGGKNHPGGTLTDTNLILSIKPSTNEAAMISLPRDLVVKIYDDENPKYWEGRKINYLYELGGMELGREKMEEITGLKIHYAGVLDFEGFRKIIDDMDGLDIYVDNAFTDIEYPDYNYGYQTISFNEGIEHMDGETALQYARSRHGNNGEGSDFSRAKRQQKIIAASKEKFLTPEVVANPKKSLEILDDLSDHISTNMEVWEMVKFAEMAMKIDKDKIINKVVDANPGGLLYSQIYPSTGAYVLIPNAGEYNYSEIHALCENIFNLSELRNENAKIEVQNGSPRNGLAAEVSDNLENAELNVVKTGNSKDQSTKYTTIYNLTDGSQPLTLNFLKGEVDAKAVISMSYEEFLLNVGSPESETSEPDEQPDFVVILGSDQYEPS